VSHVRRLLSVAVLAPLLLAAAAVPATAADTAGDTTADTATNPNRFSLTAEGNGMFFEYRGQAAPATDNVSASPWASFAAVDSQGLSRAFAGLPYFGAFLQTLPGTVNGLSGGATPPLPPLPGFTESKYPANPEGHESQGPYSIKATSDQFSSAASATSGLSPDNANPRQQIYSTAKTVAAGDGTVTSTATAGVEALTMGPLTILRFGNSESVTESGDGKPVFTTSQDLGTFEVAGVKVGVTQKGFTVGGTTSNVPANEALSTVNQVLANAGMEIAYIPRTVSKDAVSGVTSVLSGALRVKVFQDAPAEGPTTLTYVFGRATVSSSDVKDEFSGGLDLPVDLPAAPEVPAVPADAGGVVSTPVTPVLDSTGLAPAGADPGSALAPTTADLPPQSAPVQATGLGLVPAAASPLRGTSSSLFYLTLVLASAGVLVGQQLFSRFGIKLLLRGPA
jgi:hypothetical protein